MDTNQQKVAVYARVSTQEQAVEGVSIDAQIAALRANAKIQGWEITDVYIDGGYSGGLISSRCASWIDFSAISGCYLTTSTVWSNWE